MEALAHPVSPTAPAGEASAAPRGLVRPIAPDETGATATAWSYRLLLLFLAFLLSNIAVLFPSLAVLQPVQLVATAGLVLMVIERSARGRPVRLGWPDTHLLATLVCVAAISSFTAFWMSFALENTILLLKFFAVHLLIVNTIESERRLRTVFSLLAIGGLFPAVGALHYYRLGVLAEGHRARWIGIFANPNDLAYALTALLPLALLVTLDSSGWRRVALGACVGLYAVTTFLTYSRGGLIAFGLVLGLSLLTLRVPLPLLLALTAVGIVGLGLAPASALWGRGASFSDLGNDFTVKQRLETIRLGLAMFADHPLLGVGPGCSVIGWVRYVEFPPISPKWLHSHNTLVQLLSEMGILGAGAFVMAFSAAIAKARRVARTAPASFTSRAARALEISQWGFVVASLSGGLLFTWFSYIMMGLISASAIVSGGDGAHDAA